MEVVYQQCAGVDVHQCFLVVCLSIVEAWQQRKETVDLLALRTWLLQEGCRAVGMESTEFYWMPVYRRLESFFELVAANAQHIKAVPSRKTDIQDANWIADLLQHGLLTASLFRARNTRSARFNAAAGQFGSRASTSRQSRA